MKVLDLHSNELWGDIADLLPPIAQCRACRFEPKPVLRLDFGFGGERLELGEHRGGEDVSGGFFKGDAIKLFRNLEVLDLGNNQVSGKLPSFGPLPNLRVLRLANNQLFGLIPEELMSSSIPLVELDLSNNGFTG
ncbi:hypothetical protein TIFTF001_018847 [Ficus carica]|uniref:Uncharacterized protein n=1 Tax=Ficus carica TaxID=3494 RepID=A0AA88A7T6_FICCA|nr:hypothetical protein TIFTF001_018847 [Ficus carica]